MAKSTSSGFWGNMARCRQSLILASAIFIGSLIPDILARLPIVGGKPIYHNYRLPLAILCLLGFAYIGRYVGLGVLKWKR